MNLEREWDKTYYLKNSGLEVDAVMQEDGTVTAQSIDPTGKTLGMADVFGGGVKPDIYALSQAAGAPVTEAEVAGTMGGVVPGAAIGAATAIPDIAALVKGGVQAATAEEGSRIEEFLKGFSSISGVIGSEKAFELYDAGVDMLPISDEAKQGLKQGALVGEVIGFGTGAKKGAEAVGGYVEGAPARLEEAKSGVTLGMGADPTQVIDEAIVGVQKAFGGAGKVDQNSLLSEVGEASMKDAPQSFGAGSFPLTKENLQKADETTKLLVSKILEKNPDAAIGLTRSGSAAGDSNYLTVKTADGKWGQVRVSDHGTGTKRINDYLDQLPMTPPPEGKQVFGQISRKSFDNKIEKIVNEVAGQKLMGGARQVEANPNRISTRLPTAKAATEDPIAQPLQIGLDEVAADPVVFEHNVGIVKNYPNMTEAEAALPPAEAGEAFIEHAKNNLLWVFDKVPEQTRERSKKWYDGARAITDKWSEKYNLPDSSIAGVLAALSPQKDWYMNVSLAERVLDIMSNQQDTVFSKEMLKTGLEKFNKPQDQAIIKAISEKKLSELELPAEKAIWLRLHDETYADRSHQIVSPEGDFIGTAMTGKGEPKGTGWGSIVEISKAVSAFESGGDKNVLTPLMGTKHKVRSFYNNILDPNGPNGDVTIDTHAVAASLLRPLSGQATEVHHNFGSSPAKAKQGADWLGATKNSAKTGVQGNYGLYAEAYRRAAAERGVLPREMQSITWEAVRGLFTDKFKGQAKNVEDVNNIWYKYRKGEVTLDEARNAIEQRAGGINPPTWQRPSGAVDEQVQNTAE